MELAVVVTQSDRVQDYTLRRCTVRAGRWQNRSVWRGTEEASENTVPARWLLAASMIVSGHRKKWRINNKQQQQLVWSPCTMSGLQKVRAYTFHFWACKRQQNVKYMHWILYKQTTTEFGRRAF